MQNVATKKMYMVPVVAGQGTVEKTTLGVPSGVGETTHGFIIFASV
ncbi:MAG TPA: hypothetical protein VNW46_10130 [Gemmatimonadaceae bacterium]|nr:hypothetical protein [Gemmatimonadaceae bacterium]